MRLIDADKLYKLIEANCYTLKAWHNSDGQGMFIEGIKQAIDMQPTVDAVEVVHGEWKFCEDDFYGEATYKCSNCGEELVTLNGVEIDWNYCPECGAKMDGKKVE